MKENYDVTGMSCSACQSHVEKSVASLEGVTRVSVNLLTNSMQVEYKESGLNAQDIIHAVEEAGYGASLKDHPQEARYQESKNHAPDQMRTRLVLSVLFWIPLMYVAMGHMGYEFFHIPMPAWEMQFLHGNENAMTYGLLQLILLIPILLANQKYFTVGFKTLSKKSPNMDSLIAVGSLAAILYGFYALLKIGYGLGHGNLSMVDHYRHELYFESAGTILTLITVGKYLETRSKRRTTEAIEKLMKLAPTTLQVIRDGKEQTLNVKDVVVGDLFVLRPGEIVPVDGMIEEGSSSFDESAITGESMPVDRRVGDRILSASLNQSGFIQARADRVGEDTTIAKIIRLVEEASNSKAPIARMADKIAGVFVPIVMLIAFLAGVIWYLSGADFEFSMSISIAILVISCPCALGLATPVAIMVGTGKGAESGILIGSGEALEKAHLVDTVVLDKTGTITLGKPEVTRLKTYGIQEQELLQIAGTLESGSEHPLAKAVVAKARKQGISLGVPGAFQALFGKGVVGTIGAQRYLAGNTAMMEDAGLVMTSEVQNELHEMAKAGETPLIFATETQVLGLMAVADIVKDTSREAIALLQKQGIHVIMLTGDNAITANAIKEQVGVDQVIAGVLPDQKAQVILALQKQGKKVAMVGDGINDAPALAVADVSIAMGGGTDIAMESAEIILMKDDLLDVAGAIHLSKKVIRNIKENLFWAFFYNVIGIPVAAGLLYPAFGLRLNPMIGAAAMSLSSIFVVGNALRLKNWKPQGTNRMEEKKEKQEVSVMTEKVIKIEGMMCGHCTGRVETALKSTPGVLAVTVSLEENQAVVQVENQVKDEILRHTVEQAGYQVTGIQ